MLDKTIVIFGSTGMLGSDMLAYFKDNVKKVITINYPEYDITNSETMTEFFKRNEFDIFINCTGFTDVDLCEDEKHGTTAYKINGEGVGMLSWLCNVSGAKFVHFSTDYVFDGTKRRPYKEFDTFGACKKSTYGYSKQLGEMYVNTKGIVIRTQWLYGGKLAKNFVNTIINVSKEKEILKVVDDQFGTPCYTMDLVKATFKLCELEESGTYHYSNSGECTWHGFAEEIVSICKELGMDIATNKIEGTTTAELNRPAIRPKYAILSKDKISSLGIEVPDWKVSLKKYIESCYCS